MFVVKASMYAIHTQIHKEFKEIPFQAYTHVRVHVLVHV